MSDSVDPPKGSMAQEKETCTPMTLLEVWHISLFQILATFLSPIMLYVAT